MIRRAQDDSDGVQDGGRAFLPCRSCFGARTCFNLNSCKFTTSWKRRLAYFSSCNLDNVIVLSWDRLSHFRFRLTSICGFRLAFTVGIVACRVSWPFSYFRKMITHGMSSFFTSLLFANVKPLPTCFIPFQESRSTLLHQLNHTINNYRFVIPWSSFWITLCILLYNLFEKVVSTMWPVSLASTTTNIDVGWIMSRGSVAAAIKKLNAKGIVEAKPCMHA